MAQRPVLSCHHFNNYLLQIHPHTHINQQYNKHQTTSQNKSYGRFPNQQKTSNKDHSYHQQSTAYRNKYILSIVANAVQHTTILMNQPKPKKEKFRKYQYTKPFKQRDKTKDFGKDLPLKKSGRLKFPEKPQYYTLYTVKRLEPTHPFFNIRNKDIAEVKRAIEQTKKQLQRQQQMKSNTNLESKQQMKSNKSIESKYSQMNESSSSLLKSSALAGSQSVFAQNSNLSSLDVVTISSKKSKENPFSQGFTVTSGPKVYSKVSQKIESRDVTAVNTPKVSVLSDKQKIGKSVMSGLSLSNLQQLGQQLSL